LEYLEVAYSVFCRAPIVITTQIFAIVLSEENETTNNCQCVESDMHAVLVSNHFARCYVSPKPAADIHKDKSCLPALQPPHNGFGGSYQKHGQKTRKLEHVTNRYVCLEILAS